MQDPQPQHYQLPIDTANTPAKAIKKLRNASIEEVYVFPPKKRPFRISGDAVSVSVDKRQLVDYKDAIVVHNHPGGSTLSREDFEIVVMADIKVFIVVTPTHLYEVRRPGAAWKIDFNSREADVQWEAAAKLADELMTKLVQRHEISWKDREAEFFHYIWSAFFQMNEIKYVRKKHED